METPLLTGIAQAPGEHEHGDVPLVATQQASHAFYTNYVHPIRLPTAM
jgi:hypothetical protein